MFWGQELGFGYSGFGCAEMRHSACYVSRVLGSDVFVRGEGFALRRDDWVGDLGAPASDLHDTLEKALGFPVQPYLRLVSMN